MTLGERMKGLRLSAGLTQEQLAERVGLKKQNISRYENSHCEPNIRTAKRIAEALGVSIEEMATDRDAMQPKKNGSDSHALTPEEMTLVIDYRSLDSIGREYIRQTMVLAKMSYLKKK